MSKADFQVWMTISGRCLTRKVFDALMLRWSGMGPRSVCRFPSPGWHARCPRECQIADPTRHVAARPLVTCKGAIRSRGRHCYFGYSLPLSDRRRAGSRDDARIRPVRLVIGVRPRRFPSRKGVRPRRKRGQTPSFPVVSGASLAWGLFFDSHSLAPLGLIRSSRHHGPYLRRR
ncbi:MAG: hypothetical protein MNPFHGCM_01863 [Gemmatimonadaceae bacterium]|nr:hypothetical protein [Gemmatimonadaceae bacterium]